MRVLVKDSVYKDLSGLEKDRKRQGALLDAAIQGISEQHSGAIKKLKGGLKNYYRLELGNIRVIYYRRGDEAIIVRIGNRKDDKIVNPSFPRRRESILATTYGSPHPRGRQDS